MIRVKELFFKSVVFLQVHNNRDNNNNYSHNLRKVMWMSVKGVAVLKCQWCSYKGILPNMFCVDKNKPHTLNYKRSYFLLHI